jgi:hypothetical protein
MAIRAGNFGKREDIQQIEIDFEKAEKMDAEAMHRSEGELGEGKPKSITHELDNEERSMCVPGGAGSSDDAEGLVAINHGGMVGFGGWEPQYPKPKAGAWKKGYIQDDD